MAQEHRSIWFPAYLAQATYWFFCNLRKLWAMLEVANTAPEKGEWVNLEFDFGPQFRGAAL